MKRTFILLLLATVSTAVAAQDSSQLPTAPSATKYPAKSAPATSPPPAPVQSTGQSAGNQPAAPDAAAPAASNTTPANSTGSSPSMPAASGSPAARGAAPPPPSGADDEPLTTITKRVDEVNVIFTVTDKRGKFVKDLKQSDFQVIDDNRPAQSIRSFRNETNLPLRVGLLIDASNSVRDRFKF